MAEPKRDEVWIDLRPMTDRAEWRDATKYRRVVTVTDFSPHGWAAGISSWQKLSRRGVWTTLAYPAPRRTRILAHVFVQRFRLSEGGSRD